MPSCTQVAGFLQAVSAKAISQPLATEDVAQLQELGLVDVLSADQVDQLKNEVSQLEAQQAQIEAEQAQASQMETVIGTDTRRTHSVLFHFEGVDKENADLERLHEEQAALQSLEADLAKRQADFQQLLVKRSELDLVTPFGAAFIAITTAGRVALRDLNVALYRVGDEEFASYWTQAKAIGQELAAIVDQAGEVHGQLTETLSTVDPVYVWAVAIGLAKQKGAVDTQVAEFLDAYNGLGSLAPNLENRLLAAEVVAGIDAPVPDSLALLKQLVSAVTGLGVPAESAAGVAAILLSGRRADGTFATDVLKQFLARTPSYEAAALLAIVNTPFTDLATAFSNLKVLFSSWAYSVSEDTELASAYLAVSDLPAETVGSKMAILARGVGAYLQYPLVAAAVLASIPVLEANETLNLLEKAYEILGTRTGPMAEAELITLAVRVIHGVDVRSVNELDPTAKVAASYPSFSYANAAPRVWIPVYVVHGGYFATYSGIGGFHPGHFHTVDMGGWGGGFGG